MIKTPWDLFDVMLRMTTGHLFHFLKFFCLCHFFSLLSRESDAAGEADVRQEKSDLRLRHRFYHQRYAYRGQSGAPQWHEIALMTAL